MIMAASGGQTCGLYFSQNLLRAGADGRLRPFRVIRGLKRRREKSWVVLKNTGIDLASGLCGHACLPSAIHFHTARNATPLHAGVFELFDLDRGEFPLSRDVVTVFTCRQIALIALAHLFNEVGERESFDAHSGIRVWDWASDLRGRPRIGATVGSPCRFSPAAWRRVRVEGRTRTCVDGSQGSLW